MEFCINECLLLFLENAFYLAKYLPRRDAGDRGGPAKARISRKLRKLQGYFPLFFRKTKIPLCSPGELVKKG